MKKQADDNQIMLQTPLFAGADAVLLQQLLNSPGVSSSGFAKGEEIYTPAHFSNRIGILLKGAAIVEKRCGESRMLMSILKKGDLFGAATLFLRLDDTYLVSIRAVEDVRALFIEEAALQRDVEFAGGKTKYTSGTVHEITEQSTPIETEFFEFYRTPRGEFAPPGVSPLTTTHPTLSSNTKFMNFYPFEDLDMISPRPLLFITGANAHSREFSEDAYRRASEPKELLVVPDAGHVDLYDRVGLIPFDRLDRFFTKYLKK